MCKKSPRSGRSGQSTGFCAALSIIDNGYKRGRACKHINRPCEYLNPLSMSTHCAAHSSATVGSPQFFSSNVPDFHNEAVRPVRRCPGRPRVTGSANDSPNARQTMTRPGIDRLPRVWTCRWLFPRRAASLTAPTSLYFFCFFRGK